MAVTEKFNAKTDLNWSPGKRVRTRNGPMTVKTADPTPEFQAAWKACQKELRDLGIGWEKPSKWNGNQWKVCWWIADVEQEQERRDSIEKSRAVSTDFSPSIADGYEYFDYQKVGVEWGLSKGRVLIADEMGLGKTLQAIGMVNSDDSIKKVLVICPASLRLNWKKEFRQFGTRDLSIHVVDGGAKTSFPSADIADIVIINYDVLIKHSEVIRSIKWDLLVCDESHYIKNYKAKRTQEVVGGKSAGHSGIKADRVAFLSGTPVVNRPQELWTTAQYLAPNGLGRNWKWFHDTFCDPKQIWTGRKYVWDFSGASNLDLLQDRLREEFMIRRLAKDVLDLGTLRRQVIELPVNGAARAVKKETTAYQVHQDHLLELRHAVEVAKLSENKQDYQDAVDALKEGHKAAFTEMAKLRQEVALAKVPGVSDHISSAAEEHPVVVFGHHKAVLSAYESDATSRGLRVAKITGDTPLAERQQIVDDFQAGKIDVFLGNIQAAGVGITLTRSHHVIFVELPWTPAELQQAERRCYRIGTDKSEPVLVQHLVLEGSLDSYMAETLVRKQNVCDAAMDDDTGILDEPVLPTDEKSATVEYTPSQIDQDAKSITPGQIASTHQGLMILAGTCDGAATRDGVGFSGPNVRMGHSLARQATLSPRQAVIGRKIVQHHQRQLSIDLIRSCGITPKGEK